MNSLTPPSRAERRELMAYQDVALSDKDLMYILDGRANVVLYPEIKRMTSVEEILGPHGAALILFCSSPRYGHWCWLLRGVGGVYDALEFGNPYGSGEDGEGGYPDDSLALLEKRWAASSEQDVPYLSLLMIASPYKLSYNEYPLQEHKKGIRTCGRHCAARVLLRHLSLDVYAAVIGSAAESTHTTPDVVVTALTSEIGPKSRGILKQRRDK